MLDDEAQTDAGSYGGTLVLRAVGESVVRCPSFWEEPRGPQRSVLMNRRIDSICASVRTPA